MTYDEYGHDEGGRLRAARNKVWAHVAAGVLTALHLSIAYGAEEPLLL